MKKRDREIKEFSKIEYEMHVIMMLIKYNSYVCSFAKCVRHSVKNCQRERERVRSEENSVRRITSVTAATLL